VVNIPIRSTGGLVRYHSARYLCYLIMIIGINKLSTIFVLEVRYLESNLIVVICNESIGSLDRQKRE